MPVQRKLAMGWLFQIELSNSSTVLASGKEIQHAAD
jgi:hypothetical protein